MTEQAFYKVSVREEWVWGLTAKALDVDDTGVEGQITRAGGPETNKQIKFKLTVVNQMFSKIIVLKVIRELVSSSIIRYFKLEPREKHLVRF